MLCAFRDFEDWQGLKGFGTDYFWSTVTLKSPLGTANGVGVISLAFSRLRSLSTASYKVD